MTPYNNEMDTDPCEWFCNSLPTVVPEIQHTNYSQFFLTFALCDTQEILFLWVYM